VKVLLLAWWEQAFFRPAGPLGLHAARVILCLQALWILLSRPDLPELAGWPRAFWGVAPPLLDVRFGMVLPLALEHVLFLLLHAALVACLVGVWPRATALLSALLLYHFAPFEEAIVGLPHTSFGGLTLPVLGLAIVSFAPAPPRNAPPSPEYRWPLALIQLLFVCGYFFPMLAKLRYSGPGWFTGANIANYALGNWGVTNAPWALWVAGHPVAAQAIAVGTLLLETLSPLVLLSATFAAAFVPVALAFHVGIMLVIGYSFPSLPLLALLLDWDRLQRWWQRRGADPAAVGRRAAAVIALLAAGCGGSRAQEAATPAPPVTAGPQVGERIPDFTLPDQDGRPRTFASLAGPRGLVLNFNRSVVW
jgi:hypothetical protein